MPQCCSTIDPIHDYYRKILRGDIVVGRWIKRILEIVIDGLNMGLWFYNEKKANRAIEFIETFVHHSKGRNDLLKLELWQKMIICCIFGVVEASGYRQFREVFIVVARKNGKTLFAAAIAEYMAYCDKEYGAEIYCLAPKLDQAELVFNAFYTSTQQEEEIAELTHKRKKDVFIEEFNTSIAKLAFNSRKSDGFNPHLTICDELAAWKGQAGLEQYEVMKSALGARKQPLIISISTAGRASDGIYDELFKRSTRFMKSKPGEGEMRLLPFLFIIDDPSLWDDLNELRKSNPNLGVSVSEDYYVEEIKIARESESKKSEFLCKYCNIPQNSSIAWLDFETVNAAGGEHLELSDFRKHYCVVGIDLSRTTDLTAASFVIERCGEFYIITRFFMPADSFKKAIETEPEVKYDIHKAKGRIVISGEHYVDYKDVFNWIVGALKEYRLMPLWIGYDRYSAQYLVQELDAAGFHTDDVFQGTNLSPIIDEFEGLLRDGKIHIGDNELLKKHLLDSALKYNEVNDRKRLVKIEKRLHIDGTASILDAFTVRSKYYKSVGKMLQNERMTK